MEKESGKKCELVTSMTDIKTWMDDKQRIHNISNYNIFRVTMENGVVVLDVKHLSTSEIWVRLDNILTTLPTAEIKLVTPKYDDVDRFQEKLTEMIEKYDDRPCCCDLETTRR